MFTRDLIKIFVITVCSIGVMLVLASLFLAVRPRDVSHDGPPIDFSFKGVHIGDDINDTAFDALPEFNSQEHDYVYYELVHVGDIPGYLSLRFVNGKLEYLKFECDWLRRDDFKKALLARFGQPHKMTRGTLTVLEWTTTQGDIFYAEYGSDYDDQLTAYVITEKWQEYSLEEYKDRQQAIVEDL